MDVKEEKWNESYEKRQNFTFYPDNEVIRFVSSFLKKRIGIDEYAMIRPAQKILDLGCGIGRHMLFLDQYGFEPYGIDLSAIAINCAKNWFHIQHKNNLSERIFVGSVEKLPFEDHFFDAMVSEAVLDSMPFSVAKKAIRESYRVLNPGALVYISLIAYDSALLGGDQSTDSDREVIIEEELENGTIQSFFNQEKISQLLGDYFSIMRQKTISYEMLEPYSLNRRHFLVLKRND